MSNSKPTRPQLRYLRQLAERTGTTFTPPQTRRRASAEIERLEQRSRSARFERQADRRAVTRGLAEQQPASSVRDDEIQGYASQLSVVASGARRVVRWERLSQCRRR